MKIIAMKSSTVKFTAPKIENMFVRELKRLPKLNKIFSNIVTVVTKKLRDKTEFIFSLNFNEALSNDLKEKYSMLVKMSIAHKLKGSNYRVEIKQIKSVKDNELRYKVIVYI